MTQLSLFDYQPDLDYPLIVAEKWNFLLSYADIEQGRYYHAVQWVIGLGATGASTWNNIKNKVFNSNEYLEIQSLPHQTNGGSFEVDFISEQSCYLVAQNMRVTKQRPQLAEIQEYLAKSGCFVSWARQNPEKAIEILEPLAAMKRKKQIALLEQYNLDEKPEALRFKARHEVAEEHKLLVSTFVAKCDNPDIGRLTGAEYKALLGQTTAELKVILKTKSIRDALDTPQLETLRYAETMLRHALANWQNISNEQIESIIYQIMPSMGETLRAYCNSIGVHYITNKPLLGSNQS